MSKKFIIEIIDSQGSHYNAIRNVMLLNRKEYLDFIQFAKEGGKLDNILKGVSFYCVNCKSFAISAHSLYEAICELEDSFDFDFIWEIIDRLIEDVFLTDEELHEYLNYGLHKIQRLKDENLIKYEDGVCRFIADEVFFMFDKTCDCSKLCV